MNLIRRVRLLAGTALLGTAACTHSDWQGIAEGLSLVAAESAVTLTRVEPYSCGLNVNRDPVCDDTGDGFADRYGDPNYEFVHGWVYPASARINDYGEAFRYDSRCDCWKREPSLDRYPSP